MGTRRASLTDQPRILGLRILYVEDDEDIQEMLKLILESNGYEVTLAGSVSEGLKVIREQPFHLVIADYNLPDGDGATMLAQAAQDGSLRCESLILTGSSNLGTNASAYRVMRKPIDVNKFLSKIDELLSPIRDEEMSKARATLAEPISEPRPQPAVAPAVELVLYISEASTASLRALRNLQKLLEQCDRTRVSISVIDISRERPASFDEDRITFTPTLVKRRPEPRIYFLGTLDTYHELADLLCDVPRGANE